MGVSLAAEASSGKVRHHRCAAASPRAHLRLDRRLRLVRRASRAHLHPGQGGIMTAPAIPAANDAAAAYQRLRSDLAYLKLPAAAEALPAILGPRRPADHARP
jgi:hypothetical protein